MDRTIHFGDDAADARYRIQDTSSTGGDLVLAEDLDGGTVLLEYDYSASEWVSRGPVNLNGNDITNAGSITADSLEANSVDITPVQTGTIIVSANSTAFLGLSSQFTSDYYNVFLSTTGDTTKNGAVEAARINQSGTKNQAEWQLTEEIGNDVEVNYAIVKIANQ